MGLHPTKISCPTIIPNSIVVERGSESGWARPEDIERLRTTLSHLEESPNRIVYVSRSSSTRSLESELELESLLEHEGIEVIHCEKLSWAEQVFLFSDVKALIGPHGAGLTNCVFMPRGGRVVELVDRHYFNPCFKLLSDMLDQTHSLLDARNLTTCQLHRQIMREIRG